MIKDFVVLDNHHPLLIGTGENRRYLKGKIDDLRFYKGILSEAEILNLYLETDRQLDLFIYGGRFQHPFEEAVFGKSPLSEDRNV